MIDISRKHPWLFWPNSICPSFSENLASDILKGDQYYKLEILFSYTPGTKKDLFGIVPNYTGFSVVDNRVFLGIGYSDKDDWFPVDSYLEPNKQYCLEVEHKPSSTLEYFIDGTSIYKTSLENRPLAVMDNPQMFIGAAYWPTKDETDEIDFTLYKLKIYSNIELIAHHTFEKFIHSKSFDLTDNCNFIHKLR